MALADLTLALVDIASESRNEAEIYGYLKGLGLLESLQAPSFTLISRTSAEAPPHLGPYRRESRRSIALVEVIRIQITRYSR